MLCVKYNATRLVLEKAYVFRNIHYFIKKKTKN